MSTTTTITPVPQHLVALAKANEVRLARAELKRQIADGEISAASVILECPWEAESMTVSNVITCQQRWGSTRCRKLLNTIPMSENKTVGSMTERQRIAVAGLLDNSPETTNRIDLIKSQIADGWEPSAEAHRQQQEEELRRDIERQRTRATTKALRQQMQAAEDRQRQADRDAANRSTAKPMSDAEQRAMHASLHHDTTRIPDSIERRPGFSEHSGVPVKRVAA